MLEGCRRYESNPETSASVRIRMRVRYEIRMDTDEEPIQVDALG